MSLCLNQGMENMHFEGNGIQIILLEYYTINCSWNSSAQKNLYTYPCSSTGKNASSEEIKGLNHLFEILHTSACRKETSYA